MSKITKKKQELFLNDFHQYLKNELIKYPNSVFKITRFTVHSLAESKHQLKKEILSPFFSLESFFQEHKFNHESIDLHNNKISNPSYYSQPFSDEVNLIEKHNYSNDLFAFIISRIFYRMNSHHFQAKTAEQEISVFSVLKDFILSSDNIKKREYTDALLTLFKPSYHIYHISSVFNHDPIVIQSLLNSSHFKHEIRKGDSSSLLECFDTRRMPKETALSFISLIRERLIELGDDVLINYFNTKITSHLQNSRTFYSHELTLPNNSLIIQQKSISNNIPNYSFDNLKTSSEFSTEFSFAFSTPSLRQKYADIGLDVDVFKKFKTLKVVFKDHNVLYNVDINVSSKEIKFLTTTFSSFDDENIEQIRKFRDQQSNFLPFIFHFFITEYFNHDLSNKEKQISIDISPVNLSNIKSSLHFLNLNLNTKIMPSYREKLLLDEMQSIPKDNKPSIKRKI